MSEQNKAVVRRLVDEVMNAGPGWRTTWRGCDNSDWRTHRGLIEHQVHPRSALRERRAGLDPHAGDREDPVANAAV